MKLSHVYLPILVVSGLLAGCATTDKLSQKEKDRMAREMEQANQKQAQAQEKMMRQATRTTQPKGYR